MKKIITRIFTICFAIALMLGVVTPNTVLATEKVNNSRIEYNVANNYVPSIDAYGREGELLTTLENGNKEVPYNSYSIKINFHKEKETVDTTKSTITVDGALYDIMWNESNDYQSATIKFPQGLGRKSTIKVTFVMVNAPTQPPLEKYTLSFDSNGGTGTMDSINDKIAGDALTLPTNNFTKEGYTFSGWNTVANPTTENPGFPYVDGSNFTFGQESEILYAQWAKQKTVHHAIQVNDQGTVVALDDLTKTLYDTSDLAYTSELLKEVANTYITDHNYTNVEYKGYDIQVKVANSNEWTTYTEGMDLSDETQVQYTLNLVAVEQEKYTLSFNNNGGTGTMDSINDKIAGDALTLPTNIFTKEGYTFSGWNTVANPTTENPGFPYVDGSNFTFGQESEILYAQWAKQKTVHHEVNVNDRFTDAIVRLNDLNKTLYETNELAYTSGLLDEIANTYITDQNYTNVEYKGYDIQVKVANSKEWTTYTEGMELSDETVVRYMLNIAVINIEPVPPIEPEEPIVPIPPVTPEEPIVPTPPVTPEEPIIPTPPVTPEEPIIPTPPVTPEVPVVPETPVVPVTPETPVTIPDATPTPGAVTIPNIAQPIVAQTQPVAETLTEETIPENPTPLANNENEQVQENETPLANNVGASWALINLICSVLTVLSAIILFFSRRKRNEEEDDEQDMQEGAHNVNKADQEELQNRSFWVRIVSIAIALLSVIVFILTENVFNPMILVDSWTLTMVIILVVQIITFIIARKWKDVEQEEEEEPETV